MQAISSLVVKKNDGGKGILDKCWDQFGYYLRMVDLTELKIESQVGLGVSYSAPRNDFPSLKTPSWHSLSGDVVYLASRVSSEFSAA